MARFLFLLGNTPELSLAELQTLLPDQKIELWNEHLAETQLESKEQAIQLQSILGGVFKVLEVIQPLSAEQSQAEQEIADYLSSQEKITFGITALGQNQLQPESSSIKKNLRKLGKTVRYRETERWGLSTAILTHEDEVFDLLVLRQDEEFLLAQTIAFQSLEEWVSRDRAKPYSEGKKGMLPPKLARIMVNLGLGRLAQEKQEPVLYDPFCGTGTILMEAVLRGCQIVGSDIDENAVAGSLQNLHWLEAESELTAKYQIFQSAAADVDKHDWETKIDLIVTEPFLGKPNPKPTELSKTFKGLTSLYLGAFKAWRKILQNKAVVVIVFPQVSTGDYTYNLVKLIDKVAEYGYTLEVQPINYGYEKAIVKRQIMVFRYN